MDPASFDRAMMRTALRMARRGLGQTAPNPAVGAVIADEATGEVIARGWTQPGGRPHAETEALGRAGARARGATLYVTLEPCAHHGVTPPCADAILAAGVTRVVIGVEDPDARTAGQGIARLRGAGVAVDVGVMADEARWVTLGHILRVTERRPLVQLKLALGPDGSVPRGRGGQPAWVTGPEARAQGHLLRAEADAILVGAKTVADDDPELTCRLPGLEQRSPDRIVLSHDLSLPRQAKLFNSVGAGRVWVFCGADADGERRAALGASGVDVITVSSTSEGVSLREVTETLAARGTTRLLVEGGPTVWRAFSDAGLVDEAVLFVAGKREKGQDPELGSAVGRRALAPQEILRQFAPASNLVLADTRAIGDDHRHEFRRASLPRV